MSQPRQVLPGSTYVITRRTLRRHKLLRPDPEMRELFKYLLAICAERYGMLVHAYCSMSTHFHIVLTDVLGKLPKFLAQFNRLLGMCTKVLRKWEGSVWDNGQTSAVKLTTPEAVVDKIGYVLANPVASGLVKYACDWPGAKTHVDDLGGGLVHASRPRVYLDAERGGWPETAELELALPPHVEAHDADAWRDAVKASLAEHEVHARETVAENGWKFLGARRAEKVSPYERATSFEPIRGRNPTFAVGGVAGAYAAAVRALRAFRAAYAVALERWRAGVRDVVFPAGTWWMARAHSAVVAT